MGYRVLRGALSRLEPGAGKLARRVLRGGVSRKARPLPASTRLALRASSGGQRAGVCECYQVVKKEFDRLLPDVIVQ